MPPEAYAAGLDHIRDAIEGTDRAPLTPGYYIDVVLADSESAALEDAREFYRNYYGEQVTYQSDDVLSDEAIRKRGAFGPPDAVEARLAEYVEAGAERFVVRFPTSEQRRQLRAFASIAERLR
jgi:alkanesulfonate monooxygenase SsuD/methylene tetrahydromethanopterin reductase-like flavin-dependent oxidoreductase (luciferase family)